MLEEPADPRAVEARFDRIAMLDRWVQARGHELRTAYETSGDGKTTLALAASTWVRETGRAEDVEQAVAAIAVAVAAGVRTNLEPACARLVFSARRGARGDPSALSAAEHYAVLGLAAARRPAEREAAECVREAIGFARTDVSERDAALARFSELAERRLPNLGALVGAYLPFWSFPYAFRWERDAPPCGRGPHGLPDPVDDARIEGWLALAYRSGKSKEELGAALDRCAWHARARADDDPLERARGAQRLAELARALATRWSVEGAASPADAVERVAARALTRSFAPRERDPRRASATAARALAPVLAAEWPEIADLGREHRAWRRARTDAALAAA